MNTLLIINARALVGAHPAGARVLRGAQMADAALIENGWLAIENGRISGLGQMAGLPSEISRKAVRTIDASGRFILPGWCDPHTHVVFAEPREGEFVDRIKGLTYQEIATRGGGILNSARKLHGMSEDELFLQAEQRLHGMMQQGTVAVEVKSGYGLSRESELLMLRVVKRLKDSQPIPIKATLLAAHALPQEFANDREGYINMVCSELIPEVSAEGLADHVDVFCETNYFTTAEMVRVMEAGARHGLPAKVHVNQFTSIGGIQAACAHGALSVDHLEVMEEHDVRSLVDAWNNGRSAPMPTMLPSCSFFLRIPYGPARTLIDAGLPLALATDHNPGSTPSGNMNFVYSLACIHLRMLPEEAMNAMTLNAAAAMGLDQELGSLTVGKRGSVIITRKIPSLAYLPYAFGSDNIDTVIIDGAPVRSGEVLA